MSSLPSSNPPTATASNAASGAASGIALREMASADSAALNELAVSSPDTGLISVYRRYEANVYETLQVLKPGSVGVVAEVPEHPGLAGAALVTPAKVRLGGGIRTVAYFSSLVVHPAARRRGVAASLGAWRRQYVCETLGEDAPLFAYIQKGNRGSLTAARRWATHTLGPVKIVGVPPRSQPPEMTFAVRPAEEDELEEIATRLDAFYEDHLFYPPQSAEGLRGWLAATPLDLPFRHYHVATDHAGKLVAGAAVTETAKLLTDHVVSMPPALRLINKGLKIVPPEGTLREVGVSKVWHAPGALQAAHLLWEWLRWRYRESGNLVRLEFDPRSPLAEVVTLPFWWPTVSLVLALRSRTAPQDTPVYSEV